MLFDVYICMCNSRTNDMGYKMPLGNTFSGRVMFKLDINADVIPLARFMCERDVQINYLHDLGKYVMHRADKPVGVDDIEALKIVEGVQEVNPIHKQICM